MSPSEKTVPIIVTDVESAAAWRFYDAIPCTLEITFQENTPGRALARKWGVSARDLSRPVPVDCYVVDDVELGRFAVPRTLAKELTEDFIKDTVARADRIRFIVDQLKHPANELPI